MPRLPPRHSSEVSITSCHSGCRLGFSCSYQSPPSPPVATQGPKTETPELRGFPNFLVRSINLHNPVYVCSKMVVARFNYGILPIPPTYSVRRLERRLLIASIPIVAVCCLTGTRTWRLYTVQVSFSIIASFIHRGHVHREAMQLVLKPWDSVSCFLSVGNCIDRYQHVWAQ